MSPPRRGATGALGIAMVVVACAMLVVQQPGASAEIANVAISAPADMTFVSTGPIIALGMSNYGIATVEASVDTDLVMTNDAPAAFTSGTTTITWTITDATGQTEADSQVITVLPAPISNPGSTPAWSFAHKLEHVGGLLLASNTRQDGNAGAAHVFDVNTGELLRTLKHASPARNQYFGNAIAAIGETAGDTRVAVSARGNDGRSAAAGGGFHGSVTIVDAATGERVRTIYNPAPSRTSGGDDFGSHIASLGDKLVVASTAHNDGATSTPRAGMIFAFDISTGSLLYTIANPDPDTNDVFGRKLLAHDDGKHEYVYAATRDHEGAGGAVYVFNVTGATRTSSIAPMTTITGTGGEFGHQRMRLATEGDFLASASSDRTIHHLQKGSTSSVGTIAAEGCCSGDFGSRFDHASGTVYVGNRYVDVLGGGETAPASGIVAIFDLATRTQVSSITNMAPTPDGHRVAHFGFAIEHLGDGRLAVSEYLRSAEHGATVRVQILDEAHADPVAIVPPPAGDGATARAPAIVDTAVHAASSSVVITYDTEVMQAAVDIDDYYIGDDYTIVSTDVSGRDVTLNYIGGTDALGAPGLVPQISVETIGHVAAESP
ncbi:MAG: hypothetical protein OXU25_06195 [Thaumarchaeota archaeon]|nr:hypothetical protein [Nitrososphaerota archaeon]